MMSTSLPSVRSKTLFHKLDHFDVTIGELDFILYRPPDPAWGARKFGQNWLADNRYVLAFAVSGRAEYNCRGQEFLIEKGQMLCIPADTSRSARSDPDEPWSFYAVSFGLHFLGDLEKERAFRSLPILTQPANPSQVGMMFRELERVWTAPEQGVALRCRAILMNLLHVFVQSVNRPAASLPHARKFDEVIRMLHGSSGRNHTTEELAEMVGLSPSRFRVLFKEYTGYPVNHYQNQIRINKAKNLLLAGECSVAEVAKAVGFEDVYYFSRLFKKMTRCTPSHFRDQ